MAGFRPGVGHHSRITSSEEPPLTISTAIGTSPRKIDRGLASSQFGVVVLSKDFFDKGWTNYELDGIVTRSVSGEQILLPVWHNVTKAEVVAYSPSLADKLARSTATHTVEEIGSEIAELILGEANPPDNQ